MDPEEPPRGSGNSNTPPRGGHGGRRGRGGRGGRGGGMLPTLQNVFSGLSTYDDLGSTDATDQPGGQGQQENVRPGGTSPKPRSPPFTARSLSGHGEFVGERQSPMPSSSSPGAARSSQRPPLQRPGQATPAKGGPVPAPAPTPAPSTAIWLAGADEASKRNMAEALGPDYFVHRNMPAVAAKDCFSVLAQHDAIPSVMSDDTKAHVAAALGRRWLYNQELESIRIEEPLVKGVATTLDVFRTPVPSGKGGKKRPLENAPVPSSKRQASDAGKGKSKAVRTSAETPIITIDSDSDDDSKAESAKRQAAASRTGKPKATGRSSDTPVMIDMDSDDDKDANKKEGEAAGDPSNPDHDYNDKTKTDVFRYHNPSEYPGQWPSPSTPGNRFDTAKFLADFSWETQGDVRAAFPREFSEGGKDLYRTANADQDAGLGRDLVDQGWGLANPVSNKLIKGLPLVEDVVFVKHENYRFGGSQTGGICYWSALAVHLYGDARFWLRVKAEHLEHFARVLTCEEHPRHNMYNMLNERWYLVTASPKKGAEKKAGAGGLIRMNLWQVLTLPGVYTPMQILDVTADLYGLYLVVYSYNLPGRDVTKKDKVYMTTARGAYNARHLGLLFVNGNHFQPIVPNEYVHWEFRFPRITREVSGEYYGGTRGKKDGVKHPWRSEFAVLDGQEAPALVDHGFDPNCAAMAVGHPPPPEEEDGEGRGEGGDDGGRDKKPGGGGNGHGSGGGGKRNGGSGGGNDPDDASSSSSSSSSGDDDDEEEARAPSGARHQPEEDLRWLDDMQADGTEQSDEVYDFYNRAILDPVPDVRMDGEDGEYEKSWEEILKQSSQKPAENKDEAEEEEDEDEEETDGSPVRPTRVSHRSLAITPPPRPATTLDESAQTSARLDVRFVNELQTEVNMLQSENENLQIENDDLNRENDKLNDQIAELEEKTIPQLREKIGGLQAMVLEQKAKMDEQARAIQRQKPDDALEGARKAMEATQTELDKVKAELAAAQEELDKARNQRDEAKRAKEREKLQQERDAAIAQKEDLVKQNQALQRELDLLRQNANAAQPPVPAEQPPAPPQVPVPEPVAPVVPIAELDSYLRATRPPSTRAAEMQRRAAEKEEKKRAKEEEEEKAKKVKAEKAREAREAKAEAKRQEDEEKKKKPAPKKPTATRGKKKAAAEPDSESGVEEPAPKKPVAGKGKKKAAESEEEEEEEAAKKPTAAKSKKRKLSESEVEDTDEEEEPPKPKKQKTTATTAGKENAKPKPAAKKAAGAGKTKK